MHASVAVEEKELLRSIPAARVALIGRIARAASGGRGRSPLQQRFLRAYFYGVAEEDLAERAPKHLAHAALAHLEFGARRTPGRTLVQVFNPEADRDGFESAHTLVFTVTDDMPFLVDSLGMAFARAELAVHLIVHPVLQVRRDRRGQLIDIGGNGAEAAHPESWQLYEIDRVSDPAQFARLQRDLEATLSDERDRSPRRAARLRGRQDLRQARPSGRRAPVPRALDLDRVSRQPARHSGAAAQSRAGHRALRTGSGQPRRQGGAERARDLSAR